MNTKVQRHYIKGNQQIVELCQLSKELYNRCNYLLRQAWFAHERQPDISMLVQQVQDLDCYKNLHNTKTAKQTIRKCLMDWSNFKKALRAYKKDKAKFLRYPKPPKYKKKLNQVIFYKETIKGGQKNVKLDQLTTTNYCVSVPFDKDNFKQLIITPKAFGFVVDVVYEEEQETIKHKFDKKKAMTIDLGVNHLCAITLGEQRPILINGRIVKSINQWYNKCPSKTRLKKRYWRLENYFHHVSIMIIKMCLQENIGQIVIGKNDGWKQGIKMRKKDKQNFAHIPFYRLLEKIQYKATIQGIKVVFTEESYTSKASFYDRDELPSYGEDKPQFSGKRVKRGLYVTSDGFAVNADINGSMNIGRKVIPEFLGIGDRSLAARPVIINPLQDSLPILG